MVQNKCGIDRCDGKGGDCDISGNAGCDIVEIWDMGNGVRSVIPGDGAGHGGSITSGLTRCCDRHWIHIRNTGFAD